MLVQAQVQTARYEHQTNWTQREYLVLPAGKTGLLLLNERKPDKKSGNNQLELTLLNQNLEPANTKEISIPDGFGLRQHATNSFYAYLVFSKEVYKADMNYLIVEIDLLNNSFKQSQVASEVSFDLLHAEVTDGILTLAGQTEGIPLLLQYKKGQAKLEGIEINRDKGHVISLRSNDDEKSYNLITAEELYGKRIMHFRTYYEQQLIFEKKVEVRADILEAQSVGFIDGNIAVAGTYGSRSNDYVQGLFYTVLSPGESNSVVKYHDFSAFSQFFTFENEGRAEKLNSRAEDFSESGRELKLDKYLFIRNVEKADGKVVISLDVYRRAFNQMFRRNMNHYEMMHTSNSQNLDSYLIYNAHNIQLFNHYRGLRRGFDEILGEGGHSISTDEMRPLLLLEHWVVGLTIDGEVSWDNALPVVSEDRLTSNRIVSSSIGPNSTNLLYYHNRSLVFSKIDFNSDPREEFVIPVGLADENDKLRESTGHVGRWFGSTMYVWGFQRIKGDEGKRNVLYINKVEFPTEAASN